MSHMSLFLSVNRDPIVKYLCTRDFVRLCCAAHFHSDGSSQWYLSRFVTNGTITRGETGGNGFILFESGLYNQWTSPHLCLQTIITAIQGNLFNMQPGHYQLLPVKLFTSGKWQQAFSRMTHFRLSFIVPFWISMKHVANLNEEKV